MSVAANAQVLSLFAEHHQWSSCLVARLSKSWIDEGSDMTLHMHVQGTDRVDVPELSIGPYFNSAGAGLSLLVVL